MNSDKHPALKDLLDEIDRRPLEAEVSQRLMRARATAVQRAGRPPRRFGYAPAATFATACTLALLFTLRGPAPLLPPDLSTDPEAAMFVFGADDDAALSEDLAFYRWLAQQGHAG